MIKKFNELENDAKFTHNGIEYIKIPILKVSCCKSINARAVANEANTIFIQPNTEVETEA